MNEVYIDMIRRLKKILRIAVAAIILQDLAILLLIICCLK